MGGIRPAPAAAACLVLALSLGGWSQADTSSVRGEFVLALQRVRSGEPEPADSAALTAYALHDYLIAARLHRDLTAAPSDALDVTIDGFLKVHGAQPVARNLHREWLLSLADRKRWDWFLARSTEPADAELSCDRLAARLATADVGSTGALRADALARWQLPQRQPGECTPVFDWLRREGGVTAPLAEMRTRAALGADNARLARDFVADVPAPRAAPLLQWLHLLESPKDGLTVLAANTAYPVEPEALLGGVTHLSISNPTVAADLLPALLKRPEVTSSMGNRLQRAVALGESYNRQPGAVAAFAHLSTDPADTQVQEWRVRAALWAGNFTQARDWILTMPPALAAQPRWRYWYARAVGATAGSAAALPLYAEVANLRDYYGYLAADRAVQSYNLNVHETTDDEKTQEILAADPGIVRAHELFECDMVDEAGAEWNAVLGTARPALKIQAARLASRWTWYAQTIATLAQAGAWDDVPLRYPRPYFSLVADAAKLADVPVDWIYSIMRQESLFRRDAVSRADARGLMQMQPATALAVAKRWHLPAPTRQELFDPAVALPLGALHVRELLNRYSGQLDQSLAAYNAGPMAVARWMPTAPIDADIWVENVPYTETRNYIQHILEHIVAFAAVRGDQPPRLSAMMPTIDPQATLPLSDGRR